MSVMESGVVDGIAVDGNVLKMMISDHLDFGDEYGHLIALQDKINSYLDFIEAKQYEEIYPDSLVESIIIEVHFKYKTTKNCKKFLKTVNKAIADLNAVCIAV